MNYSGYMIAHPVTLEPLTDEVFDTFEAAQEEIESGSLDYAEMIFQIMPGRG